VSLHEQNSLEGNSVALNRRCNRHCNEYDRSIAVAPLTAPTKFRHVFLLNEPDVRYLIMNKPIYNNYKKVAYKTVN
jgi:hypothetical protein